MSGHFPIGRDGLGKLIQELNDSRQAHGIAERYHAVQVHGVLTMVEDKRGSVAQASFPRGLGYE